MLAVWTASMDKVPSEADWEDWEDEDLDLTYAHKIFAGKTNAEFQKDFARAVIERTDELRWMPKVPFQYYILGFRDHVMAGKFDMFDSSDAASCFLDLVEESFCTSQTIFCQSYRRPKETERF